jgi:two-component system sensor histidine kinase UhpB
MKVKPGAKRILPHGERRIVLIYAVLGSLWILFTDQALRRLVRGESDPFRLQTFKGLNFIFATAVLLYIVLIKSYQRWRRAEDKLRDTQERIACAARAVTDAVWDWDPVNDSIWWSDGFYKLFGYERAGQELTLKFWTERVHPDDRQRVDKSLHRALEQGTEKWSEEYRFLRRDGAYSFVVDKGFVIYDDAGKPCRMVGGMSDITQRKQADEKLESSRQQLRALAGRLESLREEEQSRIAREIHDELGQMLTGLKLDLRWVEKRLSDRLDPELNQVLDKIVGAGELADATIESVQKISAELRPRLLDTLGVCAAIRSEASRLQERTPILIRVDCPETLPQLSGDAAMAAYRIFQEALTNVIRHAKATEVDVDLWLEADSVRMRISDNGIGISPTAVGGIESLGLLGMQERASLLGGETTILPGDSTGSVVYVRLPVGHPSHANPPVPQPAV